MNKSFNIHLHVAGADRIFKFPTREQAEERARQIADYWDVEPPAIIEEEETMSEETKDDSPRPYTAEELREMFFSMLNTSVNYWANIDDGQSTKDRMQGLVHSILSAFEGNSGALPFRCIIIPSCHPDDPDYLKSEGENWIPYVESDQYDTEITGNQFGLLNQDWYEFLRNQNNE